MEEVVKTWIYTCPIGEMLLGEYQGKLCLCDWNTPERRAVIDTRVKRLLCIDFREELTPLIVDAITQLDEYFSGTRSSFDLPLYFIGTEFQKKVWAELLNVPFGTTISYKDLSERINMPAAVRAVANAVGANALSVIVPCHRIIGSNGTLTGYAGGIHIKIVLLDLENNSVIR